MKRMWIILLAAFAAMTLCACTPEPATVPETTLPTTAESVTTEPETEPETAVPTTEPETDEVDKTTAATKNTTAPSTVATTVATTSTTAHTPYKPAPLKWEEFYALSSPEKDAYKAQFEDSEDFYRWMAEAQEQFTVEYPDIEIGAGGQIDLSKLP